MKSLAPLIGLIALSLPLAAQDLNPRSLTSDPSATCFGGSESFDFSLTRSISTNREVDIMLLFDDTGSFSSNAPGLIAVFNQVVTSLRSTLPGVDLAFGVSRFEDYGGPGRDFSNESFTGRPFILNQAIIKATNPNFDADIAAALANTAPGSGGDGPESAISEGLYQLATGLGFDGDGNGSSLDSGPAGARGTQVNPGSSGDVPPFSSYVGSSDGNLGGAGWRPGALHIVLLATDICPIAAFPGPSIPSTVTGTGGTEPSGAFGCPSNNRFGLVGNALSKARNTIPGAVVPLGSADLPATILALYGLGIRVIGLGPNARSTTSTASSNDESVFLSAMARITEAVDRNADALVFDISDGPNGVAIAIRNAVGAVSSGPVDIFLSASASLPGLSVVCTPPLVTGVGPGDTVRFNCTFTGNASFAGGDFNLDYRDPSSNILLGSVPVSLVCNTGPTLFTLDFQTEDDFSTPLVNGQSIAPRDEFGELVIIAGSGANLGASIFDSSVAGPNAGSKDKDLLVGTGNLLILQNDRSPILSAPDIFAIPNDDQDGGIIRFEFTHSIIPQSIDLVDIDSGNGEFTSVTLLDRAGRARIYSIPPDFTGDLLLDATTGMRTLDLTVLTPQVGFNSTATAAESPGFNPTAVRRVLVSLGSSSALDNLRWCIPEPNMKSRSTGTSVGSRGPGG
jgi:hypothetical protein